VLAGIALMLLTFPLNTFLYKRLSKIEEARTAKRDERVKRVNELLQGIRVVKAFAWEPSFRRVIGEARRQELEVLRSGLHLSAIESTSWAVVPVVVSLLTFGLFALLGGDLTAQRAFVALSKWRLQMMAIIIDTHCVISNLTHIFSLSLSLSLSLSPQCRFDEYHSIPYEYYSEFVYRNGEYSCLAEEIVDVPEFRGTLERLYRATAGTDTSH
jgi:ABC-type multidrug transport system fused ATPase/permease subunit